MDQHELDKNLFPSGAASGGTFLVESDEWLSPSAYQPKSKVTIAGWFRGKKKRSTAAQRPSNCTSGKALAGGKWYYRCRGNGMVTIPTWSTGILPLTLIPGGGGDGS